MNMTAMLGLIPVSGVIEIIDNDGMVAELAAEIKVSGEASIIRRIHIRSYVMSGNETETARFNAEKNTNKGS